LSWLCKLFYLALLPEVAILSMSRVYFGGKCHNVDFILILDFVVSCFCGFFQAADNLSRCFSEFVPSFFNFLSIRKASFLFWWRACRRPTIVGTCITSPLQPIFNSTFRSLRLVVPPLDERSLEQLLLCRKTTQRNHFELLQFTFILAC